MRKLALAIGICVMVITGISVSTAGAWWDDSHGYRGLRAYGCGPPCGGGYFSRSRSACTRDATIAISDVTFIAT